MSIEEKKKKVLTAASLKKFLNEIPDKTPIRGVFSDRVTVCLWKAEDRESGPRRFISFEEAE
jgi:hypothetical protein